MMDSAIGGRLGDGIDFWQANIQVCVIHISSGDLLSDLLSDLLGVNKVFYAVGFFTIVLEIWLNALRIFTHCWCEFVHTLVIVPVGKYNEKALKKR